VWMDREFVALFMIFDENMSPYLEANIGRVTSSPHPKRPARHSASRPPSAHAVWGVARRSALLYVSPSARFRQ
jgi:hypothetical protein